MASRQDLRKCGQALASLAGIRDCGTTPISPKWIRANHCISKGAGDGRSHIGLSKGLPSFASTSEPVTGSRENAHNSAHTSSGLLSLVARVYNSDDDVWAVNAAQRK